jgi:hypothetical protein
MTQPTPAKYLLDADGKLVQTLVGELHQARLASLSEQAVHDAANARQVPVNKKGAAVARCALVCRKTCYILRLSNAFFSLSNSVILASIRARFSLLLVVPRATISSSMAAW